MRVYSFNSSKISKIKSNLSGFGAQLKNLNKLLIVGIKNMHDNTFMPLPSLQREAFQKECQSILIAFNNEIIL